MNKTIKISAGLAIGVTGLAIGLPGSPALAHVPGGSASCEGIVGTATDYEDTDTNTMTISIDGKVVFSEQFKKDLTHVSAVPQNDGMSHKWSVSIDTDNPNYDGYFEGVVGPCGQPPQPADDFDTRTDDGTCDGPGDDSATVIHYRTDYTYKWDGEKWVRTQNGEEYITGTEERPLTDAEQEKCRPENPPSETVTEDTGTLECGDTEMETRTTVTNFEYVYKDGMWIKVQTTQEVSESTRPLTAEEQAKLAEECEPELTYSFTVDCIDGATVLTNTGTGGLLANGQQVAVGGTFGVTEPTEVLADIANAEQLVGYADVKEGCAPTTTPPPPPTTTPPVPNAEVICVSTGPDYVSWQLTNTGEVAIVSPVALAPGESAVIESLSLSEGSVTLDVVFADGSVGSFTGSSDGCFFTPPVSTALPGPTTTMAPGPTTTAGPTTVPPATPETVPVLGVSAERPAAPMPEGELPATR